MLEDLVDLVFLESYLAGFVATQDRYDIAKHPGEDGKEDVGVRARGGVDA